jgi:hypothetical protein
LVDVKDGEKSGQHVAAIKVGFNQQIEMIFFGVSTHEITFKKGNFSILCTLPTCTHIILFKGTVG